MKDECRIMDWEREDAKPIDDLTNKRNEIAELVGDVPMVLRMGSYAYTMFMLRCGFKEPAVFGKLTICGMRTVVYDDDRFDARIVMITSDTPGSDAVYHGYKTLNETTTVILDRDSREEFHRCFARLRPEIVAQLPTPRPEAEGLRVDLKRGRPENGLILIALLEAGFKIFVPDGGHYADLTGDPNPTNQLPP